MTLPDDPWYGHPMTTDEVVTFLADQTTGVLSLTDDANAYGIPMSFAYHETEDRFLMDMGFAEDSKKQGYIETTNRACLTTFDWISPTNWASVVAIGPIRSLEDGDVPDEIASWYQDVATDIDVAGTVANLEWFELVVDELTGVAVYD